MYTTIAGEFVVHTLYLRCVLFCGSKSPLTLFSYLSILHSYRVSTPNKTKPGESLSPWSVPRVDKSSRSQCVKCEVKFTTVIVKKHHCRSCGEVVCGNCSTKRTVVTQTKQDSKKQIRLCGTCYDDSENCRCVYVCVCVYVYVYVCLCVCTCIWPS